MTPVLHMVNAPEFFLSHRSPNAMAAKDSGYQVLVASQMAQTFRKLAFIISWSHSPEVGRTPFVSSSLCWRSINRLYRLIEPDLVHLNLGEVQSGASFQQWSDFTFIEGDIRSLEDGQKGVLS